MQRWVFAFWVIGLASTSRAQAPQPQPQPQQQPEPQPQPQPAAPEVPQPITTTPPDCASDTTLPQPQRDCAQKPRDERWLRAGRISLEAVMGLTLGALPEVTGAYIGISVDVAAGHEAGAGMDIGTAIGAALGVGSAVYLGGHLMKGDGSYGWTVLGSTAGTGLAATLLAIKSTDTTLVLAALLPVAGGIVGYELSSHGRRANSLSIMPAIGKSSVGLMGRF